jgi:uncharacterized membrane protein (UPF0127 family)
MKKQILTKGFGYVKIGGKHYVVEVASDEDTRTKGLSRKTKLEDGFGMLFDLEREDKHKFQMEDTYIPLDMVFISKYGQIVDYIPNVQPLTDGPYAPKEKCQFVLEVPGNDLKDKIKEGDLTKMKFFDSLEDAKSLFQEKKLEEQLIKFLKEAVNVERVRRKQSTTRKNLVGGRKAF